MDTTMIAYCLQIEPLLPYFAEIPYYLWGQANYDSEGDCKKPTDRRWTWLDLQHRGTQEIIKIKREDGLCFVEGNPDTAARLALFLAERCDAAAVSLPEERMADWDHATALQRASRVASEFEQSVLGPFDSHFFWGSWKWIGWYATEYTWVGRWIMHSVVRKDARAIPLCIEWLKVPPRFPEQETALCYAIQRLSGQPERSRNAWLRWYEGGWLSKGAKVLYPEPDFESWHAELKAEFGDGG